MGSSSDGGWPWGRGQEPGTPESPCSLLTPEPGPALWPVSMAQGRTGTGTRPSCESSLASSSRRPCPAPETSGRPALASPLTPHPGILASPGARLPAHPTQRAFHVLHRQEPSSEGLRGPGPFLPTSSRKPRPRRPDEGEQHGLAPCGGGSGTGYFAASQKNAQPRPGVIRAGEQLLVLATWAPLPETYWHRSHRLPSHQPGPPPGTLSWGSTARNPGSMHDLPLSDPRPDGRPA